MADLRHRLSRASLRRRREAAPAGARHRAPQRRAGAGRRHPHRSDGAPVAPAVPGPRRPPAAFAPGSRPSGAVPEHLGARAQPLRGTAMRRYLTEFVGTLFFVMTIALIGSRDHAMAPLVIGGAVMVGGFQGWPNSRAAFHCARSLRLLLRGLQLPNALIAH